MVFQSYALFPAHDGAGEYRLRARMRGRGARDDQRQGRQGGGHPQPARLSRPLSAPARLAASASASPWAAPSCASPTCSCSTSRCPTSTPSCACRCAPRSRRCTSALKIDDRLRHPRPDRGHDHGRPHRRHERRPDRAGRLAARSLRPPGQPLRRELPRFPRDELCFRRPQGVRHQGLVRDGGWRSTGAGRQGRAGGHHCGSRHPPRTFRRRRRRRCDGHQCRRD